MSDYFAKKIDHDFSVDGVVTKEIWQQATWSAPFVDMASGGAGRVHYSQRHTVE